MAAITIPDSFKSSYESFRSYPQNLVYKTAFPPALKAYSERLDNAARRIFTNNDHQVDISIRDLDGDGSCECVSRLCDCC